MQLQRIVFLGELHEFEEIRPTFSKESRWELAYFDSETEALSDMALRPAAIVIACDTHLRWFETVRERWPRSARIVLCPPQDVKGLFRALSVAHQCLRCPCDPVLVRTTLEQTFSLLELLEDPDLQGAMGTLEQLPTLPKAHWRMVEVMNDPNLGVQDIADIVALDPALSALMLKMVRSAYFASGNPITSVRQAVGFLGPEITAGLALSSFIARVLAGEFDEFRRLELSRPPAFVPSSSDLALVGTPTPAGYAVAGSLIHDIGIVLFSVLVPADGAAALAGTWACP